jgi:hypothetical protein
VRPELRFRHVSPGERPGLRRAVLANHADHLAGLIYRCVAPEHYAGAVEAVVDAMLDALDAYDGRGRFWVYAMPRVAEALHVLTRAAA